MSENGNINELIILRVEQAKETIREVEILIEKQLFRVAINRIYYGMFYMLLALALKNKFKTSKHIQLIGWFNKTFIKAGLIDIKYGYIIHQAFDERTDSDYGIFTHFTNEEVEKRFIEMKDFISALETFINKKISIQ
ncbi:MAG: HEPN domain-containing protein [Bacteroidota bacterium]